MAKYINNSDIPLSMAVFLASDYYDHNDDPQTISVTTLLKPLRQIVLTSRVPVTESASELMGMVQNRMGAAIHDGIERAWTTNHQAAMKALGYPQKLIDRVLINPKPEDLYDGCIPVYLEQRHTKKIGKWIITGQFDFVGDGALEDFKSTSTFTAKHSVNDVKHAWQGSMYRWLVPHIITKDEMAIQFIFTDWSAARARTEAGYPANRILQRKFPLKSLVETQAFIERKLALIDQYWDAPEDQIPHCDDEDLWRSDPVFKYYKNPAATGKSTKNFDLKQDAMLRYIQDGSVGLVKEFPGRVMACNYCPAFPVCSQKDALIAQGDLTV